MNSKPNTHANPKQTNNRLQLPQFGETGETWEKYVVLTLILTVVVIGPFAYQRWSEAKRLRHIRETKHLAAQMHATSLAEYLHQLEQVFPDSTPLLLFTGNTQAQLEPCGCFIGQSGTIFKDAM